MPKKYNLRFMHIADIHLGKKQYGLDQRKEDFAKSFKWVCNQAIINKVDFIVIAGDLFDERNVNAETLQQAYEPLNQLYHDNIPVFIIEGNHDRPYYKDKMGWLEYLSERQLVHYVAKGMSTKWKNVEIVSVEGVREGDFIRGTRFTIGMLHAGVEGIIPNMSGCISNEELSGLGQMFDYLALGHIHKPYKTSDFMFNQDFAFNPGSLEHWNISEWNWNGGYYLVDVNTETKKFRAKHIPSPKRTMIRIGYHADCDKYDYALADIKDGSIVELTLLGETEKKPDVGYIKKEILDNYPDWLYIKMVDKTKRPDSLDSEQPIKNRTDLEREAIDSITKDKKLTDLVLQIKNQIDDEPEELLKVMEDGLQS